MYENVAGPLTSRYCGETIAVEGLTSLSRGQKCFGKGQGGLSGDEENINSL